VTESTQQAIRGIDAGRVGPWLADHLPGAVPPFSYVRIAGGRSNLTYEITDARERRFVLRRPPLGNVLPSAHDVAREHRIISALHPTAVPVATPLAFCADPSVNDAPFYVMDFVEGSVLRTEAEARTFDEAGRAVAGRSLVDTLAELHALEPDAVGLADLGRQHGYAERQLRRWYAQFNSSKEREVPVIDEVHHRLSRRLPSQGRTTIVHGDYRIDNCILAADGTVRAVLDWELCTLGDPLADLGLLLVYWVDDGEDTSAVLTGTATAAPGFPCRSEVVARYAERTGADLSELDFFVALGYWKLACVFEGIRARYLAGAMGDDGLSVESAARHVVAMGEAALRHCDSLPRQKTR
jgi:aminoglycoside phosphotransferase (APT) family kinase protein